MFWGPGADQPAGWCAAWTSSPAGNQPDEDRVRPTRERIGHYMFFVDLEGGRRPRLPGR